MRILADLHISPRTVDFLKSLKHDAIRVNEIMPANSADISIVKKAIEEERVVLTQDLDFSEIIALSGKSEPSLISLRLTSSRIEYVNDRLEKVLPLVAKEIDQGLIVVIEDNRFRLRKLPLKL